MEEVALAQALIRCRSITPEDDGAQSVLAGFLEQAGFAVTRLRFGETENLWARLGVSGPHLCFLGHTDVVPPGPGWRFSPFGGEIAEGALWGRGAADMKAAVAAFAAAAVAEAGSLRGSVSLLVTGDEEGSGEDGTRRLVQWLAERRALPDFCLVGEPTNPARLGEVIKIGRRGSLNAVLAVRGKQGHAAYPDLADSPLTRLVRLLAEAIGTELDRGSDWFAPSSLQVTSIDVGNAAANVIPGEAVCRLNIRFNDRHTGAALSGWLRDLVSRYAPDHRLDIVIGAEPFFVPPGSFAERLAGVVEAELGERPRFDTGGGTSDARFMAPLCPVAEFGLVGATMHQVDEHVAIEDIGRLTRIYRRLIREICG